MKPSLLRWQEPLAARQLKRDQERQQRSGLRFPWLVPGSQAALLVYLIATHDYIALLVTAGVNGVVWAIKRTVPVCEIGADGIRYCDGYRRLHYRWSEIEWYHVQSATEGTTTEETTTATAVTPTAQERGLAAVIFSVKTTKFLKRPPPFLFDPREIDECAVRARLAQHLPQQELHAHIERRIALQGCRPDAL